MSISLNVSPNKDEGLSELLGCYVDILDYSGLPTGTHKDVKALRAMQAAMSIDPDVKLIAISSGNYARALAHLAEETRRAVILACNSVSALSRIENSYTEWIDIKELAGEDLLYGHSLGLKYLKYKKDKCSKLPINVTNVSDIHYLDNFRSRLIYEVPDLRKKQYDMIFCPNGSGELVADLAEQTSGICYGFSPLNHPSVGGDFGEVSVADKLDCPAEFCRSYFSFNGRSSERIQYVGLNNSEILRAYEAVTRLGYLVEPSSSVAGSVISEEIRRRCNLQLNVKSRVLIVLTGCAKKSPA